MKKQVFFTVLVYFTLPFRRYLSRFTALFKFVENCNMKLCIQLREKKQQSRKNIRVASSKFKDYLTLSLFEGQMLFEYREQSFFSFPQHIIGINNWTDVLSVSSPEWL